MPLVVAAWWLVVAAGALIVATVALAAPPETLERDAGFYLKSAVTWPTDADDPSTELSRTYMASRHLAFLGYHVAFATLGNTLDAAQVLLAAQGALCALVVGVIAALGIGVNGAGLLVALALQLVVVSTGFFSDPMTDAPFLCALLALLATWIAVVQERFRGLAPIFAFGLLLGALGPIRNSNAHALLALMVVLVGIAWWGTKATRRHVARIALVVAAGWAAGDRGASMLRSAWVHGPPAFPMLSVHAFTIPIQRYGSPENGPVSRAAYAHHAASCSARGCFWPASRDAFQHSTPECAERACFWSLFNHATKELGGEQADLLLRDVGIEAIRAHAGEFARWWVRQTGAYLANPVAGFEVARCDAGTRAALRAQLAATDTAWGGPSVPVAALMDTTLPLVDSVRAHVPCVRPRLRLPGFILLLHVTAVLWLARRRDITGLLLAAPSALYAVSSIFLLAFCQAFRYRYEEPFVIQSAIVLILLLARVRAGRAAHRNALVECVEPTEEAASSASPAAAATSDDGRMPPS